MSCLSSARFAGHRMCAPRHIPVLSTGLLALGLSLLTAVSAIAGPSLPPASPARVTEIASWLSEKPMIFGHTADDRAAWDALAQLPGFKTAIAAGERLIDANPPDVSDENFLLVSKTGVRQVNDRESGARAGFLNTMVLAEVLENKGRFLPAIQRGIDAILGERTWVMAAHDPGLVNFYGKEIEVDLASSARAWLLALTDQWLGDRLPAETRQRIRAEVHRRVLDPYLEFARKGGNPSKGWWWLVGTNNWNPVCNAGVVGAGLILLDSREDRALLLANVENSLPHYFDGFADDGYCTEGLGYWNYGFGNYALLTESVRAATGGRIDFYKLPKARAASLYPGSLEMNDGLYPTFADGSTGTRPMSWLLDLLERRLDLGRPYWLQTEPDIRGNGLSSIWLTAFLDRKTGAKAVQPILPPRDSFPDSGIFVLRPGRAEAVPSTVALKGGNNAEHHNHNDLGSYVVGVGRATPLVDPGAETYTARTFSAHRYDSQILSSYGHAVPLVAGMQQSAGRQFAARVITHETSPASDHVALDLSAGYEVPGLLKLRRDFTYGREGAGQLIVRDEVGFDSSKTFGTALITTGTWHETTPRTLRVFDGDQGVEVTITSEGAPFAIHAAKIEGNLSSKRTATRIGIDLTAPVTTGVITMTIRPLPPGTSSRPEPRFSAGRQPATEAAVHIKGTEIAAEENGHVEFTTKTGAAGTVFRLWDEVGHSLAWDFVLPADGDYALRVRFCQGTGGAKRKIELNGAPLGGGSGLFSLPPTGGWSTDHDDWRTTWIAGEDGVIPMAALRKGHGRIVMTGAGDGLNLDWIELVRVN
jgi:hypothetical protein